MNLINWLRQNTPLNILSETTLKGIIENTQIKKYNANSVICGANTRPDGIYILKEGCLRKNQQFLGIGTILNLSQLVLQEPIPETIETCGDCELLFISQENLQKVA